ncbi:hypothetical protein [Pontibacter sp. BAB1700]|uniref:hypothetical protein n=1 Tax=Pontibacter sp. BAB1700 TaxID=1144253 RepID=UPI00026BE10D|nr:hypothetical protein [Pontibacter sp. BAB1700]EJF09468.1 hypothetical protein O71_14861 [Pontibacter sp. BAB1700]
MLLCAAIGMEAVRGAGPAPFKGEGASFNVSELMVSSQDTIVKGQDSTKVAYVREDDPKMKKKAPTVKKTRISYKRDVQRASLSKQSAEGNMIDVIVMQSGRVLRNLEDVQLAGSSGNQLASQNFVGFENMVIPFEGTVRFRASNQMGTATYDREVRFTIMEQGRWVLRIDL